MSVSQLLFYFSNSVLILIYIVFFLFHVPYLRVTLIYLFTLFSFPLLLYFSRQTTAWQGNVKYNWDKASPRPSLARPAFYFDGLFAFQWVAFTCLVRGLCFLLVNLSLALKKWEKNYISLSYFYDFIYHVIKMFKDKTKYNIVKL